MLNSILHTVDGWLDNEEAELLYRTALEARGNIVEIGSYHGRSTCVLALAAREANAQVYSIDPHTPADEQPYSNADHAIMLANIVNQGLAQWVYITNFASPDVASIWQGHIGMVFIDGDHTQVQADFDAWDRHLPEYVAFHDAATLESVKAVINGALKTGDWVQHGAAQNTVVLKRVLYPKNFAPVKTTAKKKK